MRRRFERELFLGNNSKVVLENVTFADGYSLDDFIWWEGGGERRGKMIGCGSSGAFEKRMHEERENVIRLIEQARGSMLSGHERSMKFGLDARKKN